MAETIQTVSIWHFVFTVGVSLAFAAALYNAIIGLIGINAVKPNTAKWPVWICVLLGIGLALSFGAAWQAATQLQQSDLDKRKADAKEQTAENHRTQISGELTDVKGKLSGVEGTLNNISAHDAAMSDAIAKIASAAHVPSDKPIAEIVQAIVEKLPKSTVTIKGNGNATAVGGGQTVNAANGIGAIGGTLINPQVNNFGPPPAHLTYTENVLTPLNGNVKKLLEVHVKTDRAIPAAAIGFVFSAPFTLTQEFFNAHQPHLKPSSIEQMDESAPLAANGVPIPNSLGVAVNAPAAFVPAQELIVTVESEKDIHTLQVAQITR